MEINFSGPTYFVEYITPFSIHTLEFKKEISNPAYWKLRQYLYAPGRSCLPPEQVGDNEYITSLYLSPIGIGLILKRYKRFFSGREHFIYYLSLRVNPAMLLHHGERPFDPAESFRPSKQNVAAFLSHIDHELHILLQEALGETIRIDDFTLNRLDFCVNCRFNSKELAKLAMKLVKKSAFVRGKLGQFTVGTKYSDTQHREVPYKHSLSLKGSYFDIAIYDKSEQLIDNANHFGFEAASLAEGIIRFEVRTRAAKIRQLRSKYRLDDGSHQDFLEVYCRICGARLDSDMKFCRQCGEKVDFSENMPEDSGVPPSASDDNIGSDSAEPSQRKNIGNLSVDPSSTPVLSKEELLARLRIASELLEDQERITGDLAKVRNKMDEVRREANSKFTFMQWMSIIGFVLPVVVSLFLIGQFGFKSILVGLLLGIAFAVAMAVCAATVPYFMNIEAEEEKKVAQYLAIELPPLQEEEAEITGRLEAFASAQEYISAVSFLPEKYRDISAVRFIRDALLEQKADTLYVATELYEKDQEYTGPRCPQCNSKELHAIAETNTNVSGGKGYGVAKGLCGSLLLGPFGLLCGLCGMKSKETTVYTTHYWVCNKCGKKFRQ